MMEKLNGFFFFQHDDLLEKYNTIKDNISTAIKKSFIASLFSIKVIWKPRWNLIEIKWQIFRM